MYNGTCEGTNQEARPCNNMKALQQDIATLQRKNTELQEENRKLKEKLDTMEPKSTKGLIISHIAISSATMSTLVTDADKVPHYIEV